MFGHYIGGYSNNKLELQRLSQIDCIAMLIKQQLLSDHRKWSPCLLCLPILGQILTRGSLRIMVKNVDPNYDAYRRQNYYHRLKVVLAINMYTFVKYDARLSLWRVFSARYSGDHVWRWNPSWSQPLRQANTVWRNPDWLYAIAMTCLCQLMFTTALKIAAGFPIHVGNRTR